MDRRNAKKRSCSRNDTLLRRNPKEKTKKRRGLSTLGTILDHENKIKLEIQFKNKKQR